MASSSSTNHLYGINRYVSSRERIYEKAYNAARDLNLNDDDRAMISKYLEALKRGLDDADSEDFEEVCLWYFDSLKLFKVFYFGWN